MINEEKLTYIAEHDKLTSLLNRQGYDAIYRDLDLEKTIYILLDIDDFKSINDNYGHVIGDRFLKKIAAILLKYFPDDYVCRLGGDEFAILISGYQDNIKEELIKKFNAMEKEATDTQHDRLPSSSISIGVVFGSSIDTTDTLYRKADKAMYHVKGISKNGYCFYDEIKGQNK